MEIFTLLHCLKRWMGIVFLTVWLFTIIFWVAVRREMGLPHCHEHPNYGALKRRLAAYAMMKGRADDRQKKGAWVPTTSNILLTSCQHEVLLGILKKVEAKNAVIATFWAIVMAGLIAVGASSAEFKYVALLLIGVTLPFLLAILVSVVQVDQIKTNRVLSRSSDLECVARLMQEDLMMDLLKNVWSAPLLQGFRVRPSGLHKCIRPLISQPLLATRP